MQLFIPTIGTILKLTQAWNFTLIEEYRNYDLLRVLGDFNVQLKYKHETKKSYQVTLPAGTFLTVSRIYIRANNSAFDSLSFKISSDNPLLNKQRFWAKLNDVNQIQADVGSFEAEIEALNPKKKAKKIATL